MKKSISIIAVFLLWFGTASAQEFLEGTVFGQSQDEENQKIPLVGANAYWMGTSTGAATDENGAFRLKKTENSTQLVVSYIGFQNDTIDVSGRESIEIVMKKSVELDEVEIRHHQKSTEISFVDAQKTEQIGEDELLKAACCNLSESFETSPSVDVSFTDAVTGTRQIQMLGLAGPYTQITRENMPHIRGLAAIYGLTYVPGPWVESIQLNKGAGSVANGFESIAGQINTELRKPESSDRMYLNVYGNQGGRMEGNANFSQKINDKWSTAVLLHAKNNSVKWDRNNDGFLDMPLGSSLIGLNRWKFFGDNGLRFQAGVKGTYINNIGGQTAFNAQNDAGTTNSWGMELNTKRLEGWTKIGKVYAEKPWKSVGLQVSGTHHDQHSLYGTTRHGAQQNGWYANLMYQSIISNTNHQFKTGASFQYDAYRERLDSSNFDRTEIVPGAYFEYTYSHLEKFDAVAGIRADYHNQYGAFVTPRLHLRYAPAAKTVIRASAGQGRRSANVISENHGLLASSRDIIIQGDGSAKPFGLEQEVAWNYGLNFTQNFRLAFREGTFTMDFYRTDFVNQIVVDLDRNPQQAMFYNLDGESYSNSFQAQVDYELFRRLDVRLAYRWLDVKTTYSGTLRTKPLLSSHRAFINAGYETRHHWKFDATLNWQGEKRIPFTQGNPEEYQLATRSPSFFLINAQITKVWREKFEVYTGVENLLNFRQDNPILASEQPFSDYFDSSLVWGPVFGRNIYLGLRYRIR